MEQHLTAPLLVKRSAKHLRARLPKMVIRMARQEGCNEQVLGICLLVVAVDYSMSMVDADGWCMVDLKLVAVVGAAVKQRTARVDEQAVRS